MNLYDWAQVFTDKIIQSQHDITGGLLLHQLSDGSWMSLGPPHLLPQQRKV
jgi:hypothetical protein